MTEANLEIYLIVAGAFMMIGAFLYQSGGWTDKLDRRLMGAFMTTIGINIVSILTGRWGIWQLWLFPILFFGRSMGYGVNDGNISKKILRRGIYALSNVLGGILFCCIFPKAWMIFVPHVGIAAWSIWTGVKNPIHARAEEWMTCILLDIGLFMYPFLA